MKKWSLLTLVFALFLVLGACGSKDSGKEDSNSGSKKETITVTNDFGIQNEDGSSDSVKDEVKVPKNPKKVVAYDMGFLDTLDTLGVKIAGVPQDSIPTYLKKYEGSEYENVGSLKEPDFEKLATIAPDVIFISGRQASLYKEFSEIAPTVYVGLDTANYIDSFKKNTELAGQIFDKEDQVKDELSKIDDTIAKVQGETKDLDKKSLIILGSEGKISAYGPASRFGLIHDVFGFKAADEGIEVSTHGQNVSYEYVLEKNPDIIFVVDRDAVVAEGASAKKDIENDIVKKTTAYKESKIIYLNPEVWYLSGGGLQSVAEMAKEVESAL
ncbi:siderophore ABC transporter substrate-binding protein [uncultured Rummeliibacillus sp.]|nr:MULTISPECIES: siderophore ABC transporter substrate-binding protein [unclassified Rummeliibacillus]RIJ63042.1 siderophore ABC transporter substrate-binding protein [Rummeliibacillus sp. POC4]RPJ96581.1 siderophore ABC transporter substrate-binding protein [Rummeliibacillus sp. TYF005]